MHKKLMSLFLFLVLFMTPDFVSAADALQPVPLGKVAADLYNWSLGVAGMSVFIMFILAGLATMVPQIASWTGKPEEIMKNAVIGLIILVSAYMILNTINGDLVKGDADSTSSSPSSGSGALGGARTPTPTPLVPYQGGGGSFGGGGATGRW